MADTLLHLGVEAYEFSLVLARVRLVLEDVGVSVLEFSCCAFDTSLEWMNASEHGLEV